MALTLTRSDLGILPRSPLELVVCQVRHEDRHLDASVALHIQDALGGPSGRFSKIEEAEIQTMAMGMNAGAVIAGPPDVARGWHLKSPDGAWTVALLPGHFAVETTRYTDWNDFMGLFSTVVEAVARFAPPTIEQRIGLRYVDRLSSLEIKQPADWERWIDRSVLGPVVHGILSEGVIATRQQVDLDLGEGRRCVLRHGAVADGRAGQVSTPVYLLDFDVFREQARRFDAQGVLVAAQDFHEQADALFQQVITPELLRYLAGEDDHV